MVLSRIAAWPALLAVVGALVLAACGAGGDNGAAAAPAEVTARPVVVATTGIWADVAGMVACDGS